MQKYTDVVTSARSGAAIPNARVTVKTYPGDVAATIYSDDGITTQDNPITTDSRGAFSFYAADGRYSLVVSGTGITEQTLTDHVLLADPDDEDAEQSAADVEFVPSGSGAIAQDLQTRGRRTVFVTDYIPTNLIAGIEAGTNTTALETYIEAAIASLGSNGGEVVFPPGTYYVSASVDVDDPGVVLRGMAGSGWSVGSAVRITTDQAIVVLNLTSGAGTRGAQVRGISILDTAGSATGAIKVDGQWNCLFQDVAVNNFSTGYAFSLDGSSNAIALTRFEGCQGRNNKYGIRMAGTVAASYISPNTYFADPVGIAGGIGIEMMEGKMFGAVDSYETGCKVIGDDALIMGRFEGNDLHVHIAGTTSRRNKVIGSTFTAGGATASVQLDAGANIFDNVVAFNTYASPAVGIVDNSSGNNFIFEPQQNNITMKRSTAGTVRHELRNTRNNASGDHAEYLAAIGTTVKAVLRAHFGTGYSVQLGSDSNHNVDLIHNATAVGRLTSSGPATTLGGSTSFAQALGTATVSVSSQGNSGTGEDDLLSYSLPANTLSVNGTGVEVEAWGDTANNANAKTVKLYFGATAILTMSLTVSQLSPWHIRAVIMRTASNVQRAIVSFSQGGTTKQTSTEINNALAATDSGAITIKCTGEATSNNDIIQRGVTVKFIRS